MSTTIERNLDKSMISVSKRPGEPTATFDFEPVDQPPSRMRSVLDTYTVLSEVSSNAVGIDSAPNVKTLHMKKPCKISKFKIPQNMKTVQWRNVAAADFPGSGTPAWLTNNNMRTMAEFFYPNTYGVPLAGQSSSIPTNALLFVDSFPRMVNPPNPDPGSDQNNQFLTQFSFTVYKNLYFECQGKDVNGNAA